MEGRWQAGVGFAVLGAVLTNVGINFQKYSHRLLARHGSKQDYCRSPVWMVGILIMILGAVADFLALGLAPQTIVAPVGGLTLVSNLFVARWMHGEVINNSGLFATACILFGVVLNVIFASHKSKILNVEEVIEIYMSKRFLFYASCVIITVGVLWNFAVTMNASPDVSKRSRKNQFHRLSIAALSGILGSQNVLFAKFASQLLLSDVGALFDRFFAYFTLACLSLSIVTQVRWLNEGLRRFDAMYMVPVSRAFWVFFSVLSGMIVFQEYQSMTSFGLFMFTIAIGLVIFGVSIMSRDNVIVSGPSTGSTDPKEESGTEAEV